MLIHAIVASPTNQSCTMPIHVVHPQMLMEKKRSAWQPTCFLAQIHARRTLGKDIWFAIFL